MLALWIKSIEKTLIKITILVIIFSVFLEINYHNFVNYLIFLVFVYIIGFLYILYKTTLKVEIYDDFINIKTLFSLRTIKYSNIMDFFSNVGYLQKKFGLISIYIITKNKNYVLKDMPDGKKILSDIEMKFKNKNINL